MSVVDVVTDLLGEIIEIYEWGDTSYVLRTRGTVRALYLAEGHLTVLVEHNLGFEDGGFEAYEMLKKRVRSVQQCARCSSWDQKALMEQEAIVWEHRPGQGCKHDG